MLSLDRESHNVPYFKSSDLYQDPRCASKSRSSHDSEISPEIGLEYTDIDARSQLPVDGFNEYRHEGESGAIVASDHIPRS